MGDVGRAVHQDGRRHPVHLEVVGAHHAALDQGVGADAVEGQAFREHVVEIELEQARQGLQAEHPEQLGRARVLLQELARFYVHLDLARQARDVQVVGQSAPGDIARHLALAAAQGLGEAEPVEQLAGVNDVEHEIQAGVAAPILEQPASVGLQLAVRVVEAETVDAPFAAGQRLHIAGLQFQAAEALVGQLELFGDDVERGDGGAGAAVRFQQMLDLGFARLRDHQRGQARRDLAHPLAPACFGPGHVAARMARMQVGLPGVTQVGGPQHHVGQAPLADGQFAHPAADQGRHHVLGKAGAAAPLGGAAVLARDRLAGRDPAVRVQRAHVHVDHHAAVRRRRRHVDADPAAQHGPGRAPGLFAHVARRHALAQRDADLVARHPAQRRFARQHEAQRQAVRLRLVERRRQFQAQAGQVRIEGDGAPAFAHHHAAGIGRAAREALRQPAQRRRRRGAAHALGVQGAVQANRDAAVLLGAAGQTQRPAQEAGTHAVQGDAALPEFDLPFRRLQWGQFREQGDVVAQQLQAALHAGFRQVRQRHAQAQAQARIAAGAGLVGEVADPFRHRAGRHVAQEFLHRRGSNAVDLEHHLLVRTQVRNHRLDVGQRHAHGAQGVAADFHARAVELDAAVDVLGQRPLRGAVGVAVAGCVFEARILEAAGDVEFAAGALQHIIGAERESGQVAAQAQARIAQGAALQRVGQPVAQVLGGGQRQEAPHRADREAVQRGADVGRARPCPAAIGQQRQAVASGQRAGQRPLREGQAFDLDQQLLARVEIPARLQVEPVERHRALREPGRHVQDQRGRIDRQAAAVLAGVDAAAQVLETGRGRAGRHGRLAVPRRLGRTRRLRIDGQAGNNAAQAVAAQRRIASFPFGRHVEQAAARGVVEQHLALLGRQRQVAGQGGQRADVELARAQLAVFRLALARRAPGLCERGGRQRVAVAGGDGEIGQADGVAVGAEGRLAFVLTRQHFLACGQASGNTRQLERRQGRAQARIDVGQGQVGGEAGDPGLVDIQPGAHRTASAGHPDRQVDVALPGHQVGIAQVGIQLALPARDVRGTRAETVAEARAHVERPAERARRGGAQREAVAAAEAVQQRQGHVVQDQGRPAAQLVGPVDPAAADHDLALAQQPVGAAPVVLFIRVEPHPGHADDTVAAAPHVQLRTVHFERLQARLQGDQAPPGQGGRDLRQGQQLAPAAVDQAHVAERQYGMDALPAGFQLRDADAVAERAPGGGFDVAFIQVDIGQDGVAQRQEQQRQPEIQQQHQLDGKAEEMVRGQVRIAIARAQPMPAHACFLDRRPVHGRRLQVLVVHQAAQKGSP